MTGYVVSQGEEIYLEEMTSFDMTLRLYSNDVTSGLTPTQINALDETDFTEATFPGYASISLVSATWVITTASTLATAEYPEQTFTRSTAGTAENIRGHYVTRSSDGALIQFTNYAGPIAVAGAGQTVDIIPRIRISDQEADGMPVGTIIGWSGSAAPDGWELCQGQAISRTTFAELFSVTGTAYGIGDGSSTFNLPDLRQRFPLGKADSGTGASLGDTGGAIDHVHDHDGTNAAALMALQSGINRVEQEIVSGITTYTATRDFSATGGSVATIAGARSEGTRLAGDTQGSNPPYQVANYIIKVS